MTPGRVGLRPAIAAEWTKLRSLRSMTWTLVATAALTVGTAVLVAVTGSLPPGESVLAGALGNAAVAQIGAGILGVLIVTTEYAAGTIRPTLAAVPRRTVVLVAKTAVAAAPVFLVALASTVAAHRVAAGILAGRGHPTAAPATAVVGMALSFAAVAVIGVAAGTVVRHTAPAICCVIALLLAPVLLAPLLGRWQPWIAGATPLAALQKLAGSSDAAGSMGAWPTLLLVCAGAGAALVGAGALLARRDA